MTTASVTTVVIDNSFAVACVVPEAHTVGAQTRLFAWDAAGIARFAPALLAVEAASVCRNSSSSAWASR